MFTLGDSILCKQVPGMYCQRLQNAYSTTALHDTTLLFGGGCDRRQPFLFSGNNRVVIPRLRWLEKMLSLTVAHFTLSQTMPAPGEAWEKLLPVDAGWRPFLFPQQVHGHSEAGYLILARFRIQSTSTESGSTESAASGLKKKPD